MAAPEPAMGLFERGTASGTPISLVSRKDVLALSSLATPLGTDFLLLLVDSQLNLVDAWKLPRGATGRPGFPTDLALRLALGARAAGMLIVQERDPCDPSPRRADLELTSRVRAALCETGTDLVDHLLISGGQMFTVGGLSTGRPGTRPFTEAM